MFGMEAGRFLERKLFENNTISIITKAEKSADWSENLEIEGI